MHIGVLYSYWGSAYIMKKCQRNENNRGTRMFHGAVSSE